MGNSKKIIDFKTLILKFRTLIKTLRWTALDTHILSLFVSSFLGSLLLFISIYQLTQLFQDLRYLPQGADILLLAKYYYCSSLFWLTVIQPFSFLFATVYVLSRLAQQRELIAIISTGVSIYRISFYVVLFTVLYYFFQIFYFQNSIVFPAFQQKNVLGQIIFQKANPKTIENLKDNNNFSIFGANNLIYIVGKYNAAAKEMENITIVQLNNKNINTDKKEVSTNQSLWLLTNITELTKERSLIYPDNVNISLRIDADKAVWDNKNKDWILNNGTIRFVKDYGDRFVINNFTNQNFDFIVDPPYYFEKIWYSMDAMTYEEGKQYIDKLKKSHQDYKGEESRHLSKFSYPLGIIFIVLAGIGIVDLSRRKISFIMNLMICLAIFVAYYLFFAIGNAMAGKGNISPQIGAYAGSLIFGIASIYLYLKAKT